MCGMFVVRRGVFVEVWYEPTSASAELPGAADYGMKLNFHPLYDWSTDHFKAHHPLPTVSTEHATVKVKPIKQGLQNGRDVLLGENLDSSGAILRIESLDGVRWYEHADPGVLERYVPLIHGAIDWK